jgi:hypothetical protein
MTALSMLFLLPVSTFSCLHLFCNLIGYVFQGLVLFIQCIVDNKFATLNQQHAQCALCILLVECCELFFQCPCCCLCITHSHTFVTYILLVFGSMCKCLIKLFNSFFFCLLVYCVCFAFTAFPQMCVTAIGNLMQASVKEGSPRTMFSKERDIIPFIDSHWEGMTTMPRRVTQSWHVTVRCHGFSFVTLCYVLSCSKFEINFNEIMF